MATEHRGNVFRLPTAGDKLSDLTGHDGKTYVVSMFATGTLTAVDGGSQIVWNPQSSDSIFLGSDGIPFDDVEIDVANSNVLFVYHK